MQQAKANPFTSSSVYKLLIVCLALVMLPHFQYFSFPHIAALSILILWASAIAFQKLSQPVALVRVVITLILFAEIMLSHHLKLGLQGGSLLLALMIVMKTLEIRNIRDFYIVLSAVFFLQISQFFHSQSIPIAFYMLLLVMLIFTTFREIARLEHHLKTQDQQLAYLSLNSQFSIKHHLKQPEWRLFWIAIPIAVFLFLFFPRLPNPLWGLPNDANNGKTGLSNTMSPGSLTELFLDDSPAFRASFKTPMPLPAQRYWRGLVMWHYDGKTWEHDWLKRIPTIEKPEEQQPEEPQFEYEIQTHAYHGNWLISLDYPNQTVSGSILTRDGQVLNRKKYQEAQTYGLTSSWPQKYQTLPDTVRQLALQLPADSEPQTRRWAKKLVQQYQDPEKLVEYVLNHFSQEAFFYSLAPPALGDHPVDDFLFTTRTGYCEHYSSAFVILMRAAGIPARVVTGYQGGYYNRMGDYIVVRKSDAHAWTEVWLQDQGWVRIDPTAAVAPERIERSARAAFSEQTLFPALNWWHTVKNQMDILNHLWHSSVIRYSFKQQMSLTNWINGQAGHLYTLLTILVGTMLFALLIWLYFLKRSEKPDPFTQAFEGLILEIKRCGYNLPQNIGPEFLIQWSKVALIENDRQNLQKLMHQYLQLRYGKAVDITQSGTFLKNLKKFRLSECVRSTQS